MKTLITFFSIIIVIGLSFGLISCETEPASQTEIRISPSSVNVSEGQSVEFTAQGWTEYVWELSDYTAGTLSTRIGPTTVYTAIRGDSAGTNTIECLPGNTGTNGHVKSGFAFIFHQ